MRYYKILAKLIADVAAEIYEDEMSYVENLQKSGDFWKADEARLDQVVDNDGNVIIT